MRTTAKLLTQLALTCFAVAPIFAIPAQEEQKECAKAEAQSDQLKDWNSAYQFFKRFAHCDDGAVAEGYAESVAKLFAKDWKHFGIFSRLASRDKDFKAFDLKAIAENAKLRCPSGRETLCKGLERKARSSLRNLVKMGLGNKTN